MKQHKGQGRKPEQIQLQKQQAVLQALHGAPMPTAAQQRRALWALLAAALAVRLVLALLTPGYRYDVSCFAAWAMRMAETGPAGFYAADYFCDYPPGYLWGLWLVGGLMKLLRVSWQDKTLRLLLALLPALADCGMTALVYRAACPRQGHRAALWFAGALAFCPALLYDTAIWKQIEGVFTLPLLACFLLLEAAVKPGEAAPRKKRLWAAVCYGAALAVKPQALLAGPVLAVCFLQPLAAAKSGRARRDALAALPLAVGCALAPVLLCGLPFYGAAGVIPALWGQYFATAQSYPYACIDAFNLMSALGGNWQPQTAAVRLGGLALPISWQGLGMLGVLGMTVLLVLLAWRSQKSGRFSPTSLAAVYLIGIYTLSHRMHERYLVPGILLLGAAAALLGSRRLLELAVGFSLIALVDLAAVYTTVGGDDQYLTSASSTLLLRWLGTAEVVLFVLLAAGLWRWAGSGTVTALSLPAPRTFVAPPVPQRRWRRGELALLAGLTLVTAVFSFAGLGDRTAPQRAVNANGGSYQAVLVPEGEPAELWVYCGISTDNDGRLTITDSQGRTMWEQELDYLSPFAWQTAALLPGEPFYNVTLTNGEVMELAFKAADGTVLPVREEPGQSSGTVTGQGSLCDEGALVPQSISCRNSFYFDEIYHARTGYELLHGRKVYETTHPPLGKLLIALGIALFGMTGFGWRFSGALFGVLLVPLLYLLVRRLTRRPAAAGFAAALLALDFMRYTQSRLATIDTYAVFFILLGAYCMLWYAQLVLEKGVLHALLPMALGGAAFGLGCAAKWTGMYAGVGLAMLYFGVLARRRVQLCGANSPLEPQAGRRLFRRELTVALAGGVVCYVLLPLVIYLAAYLPYLKYDPAFGLGDWWRCQQSMLRYHSQLQATHPFSSPWYSWLLDLRPVWYYMGKGLPDGLAASIAGFVSPVLCWCGGAAMLWLLGRTVTGRGSAAGGFLLVCCGSSLLPWLLVTRCTFLYHYFPCLPFLAAALAVWLDRALTRNARRGTLWGGAVLAAAAGLLVWFWPVLSGAAVGTGWAASLRLLPSWGFYIL